MPFKRRQEPTTVEDERAALQAQNAALEDLKRQLTERVEAVRQRELELHHALAEANGSPRQAASQILPPTVAPAVDIQAATNADALDAQRRERDLAEREQAVTAAEVALAARTRELARNLESQADAATTVDGLLPAAASSPAEPDIERLAQIEARLAELRDAERLFLRTRDELASRSEAVAARESLVAQKERELDDREDGVGQWANPGLTEMEARLRRLEQQQDPGEQTLGFSGGLRKLQQGTARPRRVD